LLESEEIFRAAVEAKERGAREFSIVTSGLSMRNREELVRVGDAVERIGKELGLETCVSLGALPAADVEYLLSRGLRSVHHNLETSRSFFPNVCTTHEYDDDIAAVRAAKAAGAWVCCGGIFGLGESPEDRVELALTIRDLDVDSIPVNFLNPVPGTPMEGRRELTPMACLRIIAMLRLTNPTKEIIVCGGREVNMRGLQSLMFAAGATGTMAGNYLTTAGRPAEEDLQMLRDLGLRLRSEPQNRDVP
jgi:biotin synthase